MSMYPSSSSLDTFLFNLGHVSQYIVGNGFKTILWFYAFLSLLLFLLSAGTSGYDKITYG